MTQSIRLLETEQTGQTHEHMQLCSYFMAQICLTKLSWVLANQQMNKVSIYCERKLGLI